MPTVAELARQGLAHPVSWTANGTATRYSITAEGHALLGTIMRENALEERAKGSADWTQPPSRLIPGITQSGEDTHD